MIDCGSTLDKTYANAATSSVHRRQKAPFVGVWIVALDGAMAYGTITAAHRIEATAKHRNASCGTH